MENKKRNNAYANILKYTSLFGGVQALNILVALVRNKIVAVLLGPMGVGLITLFNSTIRFIGDSTNLGIGVSAVKHISEAHANDDKQAINKSVLTVRAWSAITAILGMLACALLSPMLSKYTFGWGKHTFHFLLLSPIVAMTAIMGGELAILKGTRHLRGLAHISIINVVMALVISTPLFFIWRSKAIVPSMILVAFAQLVVTIAYSYHFHPLRLSLNHTIIREGGTMVKLGIGFFLASMFGSCADFLIRSFVNNAGSPDTLGLFNAGYMITMTYGGMVFSAMETDYYPRLSAISRVGTTLNNTVNKQIEVSLLIISPMLVGLIIGLPIILPLLYSHSFLPVTSMAQLTALTMFLRAVKLPVAYLPLSRGDSKAYLLMEGIYAVVYVILSVVCFQVFGLIGMGIAIVLVASFDFIMLNVYMRHRYGYRLSGSAIRLMLQQFPIGIAAYVLTLKGHGMTYWVLGILLTILSSTVSYFALNKRTQTKAKPKSKTK